MYKFESDADQRSFRSEVRDIACHRSAPADASRGWRDLTEGRSSILDAFTSSAWSYLVTSRDMPHVPVSLRGLHILERVVTGTYPKVVAAELHLSQSTVACATKQALACLGASCVASKVPLALVALIHCARSGAHVHMYGSAARLLGCECEIWATPTPSLAHLLPPVVEEVLNLHIAGKSHREMAVLRGTSSRTIANQLATAFERIGSSGRLNVLDFLLSGRRAVQRHAVGVA